MLVRAYPEMDMNILSILDKSRLPTLLTFVLAALLPIVGKILKLSSEAITPASLSFNKQVYVMWPFVWQTIL